MNSSKDLTTFKIEMKENIKLEALNEASSSINTDAKIKEEFPLVKMEAHVKHEVYEVPSFSLQLKLETFDQKFCVKNEDDDNDIKLELLHHEVNLKTEMQSDNPDAIVTQCSTDSKSPHAGLSSCKCSKKYDLSQQKNNHTGEKRFQCSVCNYKCSKRSCLQQHRKTHTREKPFKCNVCDIKFSDKNRLGEHMRTHTGEKPFQCNICSYKCSRKRSLTGHMISHITEKHFQNHYTCNTKISRKSN